MLYQELKQYFEDNWSDLPDTLDGGHKYYCNVRFTVELLMHRIENDIEKNGKPTIIARTSKDQLQELHKDLKERDRWDKKLIGSTYTIYPLKDD